MLYAHINQKEILIAQWMNRLYAVMELASSNPITILCLFVFIIIAFFLFIYLFIQLFEYN